MTTLYTARASAACGEELHAVITSRTVADPGEYPELRAHGETVLQRIGWLVSESGHTLASVRSAYVPGRVPMGACRLLGCTSVPLGTALEPYGAERADLEPDGKWTRGLLYLPGCAEPVAMAWELALQG
jgi:hypothetical protein